MLGRLKLARVCRDSSVDGIFLILSLVDPDQVKIFHEKPNFQNVTGKIGSLDNVSYSPGGGKVCVQTGRNSVVFLRISEIGLRSAVTAFVGSFCVACFVSYSFLRNCTKCTCVSCDRHVSLPSWQHDDINSSSRLIRESNLSVVLGL